jgi:hypothetical protein
MTTNEDAGPSDEQIETAIDAWFTYDEAHAHDFKWRMRNALLEAQALAPSKVRATWHMACGDWKEELVALHGPQGHIVSGLTVEQARAIINAHGGSEEQIAAASGGEKVS